MVVKLHNWLLSSGYECTGCPGAKVQGAALFKAGSWEDECEKSTISVLFGDM